MPLVVCPKTGKVRHPSPTDARQHLQRLMANIGYGGTVYACEACDGWHVGSSPLTKRKR